MPGAIQPAAGRLYCEMPSNAKLAGPWTGDLCSGTVVTENTTGRSLVLTGSHCGYDDVNKVFARNVLFIPNQAVTSGSGTDLNCSNDPLGCWVPSFGVVDVNGSARTFPDDVAWDYASYVVSDDGAHESAGATSMLDDAAGSLPVSFALPFVEDGISSASSVDFTHALGYSYTDDLNFMYCTEDIGRCECSRLEIRHDINISCDY